MHVAMQLDSVTASSWLQMLLPFILTACCHKTNLNIFFPPFWVSLHLPCKQQDDCLLYKVQTRKGVEKMKTDITITILLSSHESSHIIVDQPKETYSHFRNYVIQTNWCFRQTIVGKANLMLGSLGCELPAHLRPVREPEPRDQCKEEWSEAPCSHCLLD